MHSKIIPTNKIYRSNQILHDGRYIKYPFENDLSSLSQRDCKWCLDEFLVNPYENIKANNMSQFFLKTFGEGITDLYLRPYNKKIWKFDPSCLDLQMVGRIPKPPKEDVIASANGAKTEGYLHQLYFNYPVSGGFQTLINKYTSIAKRKGVSIELDSEIKNVKRESDRWIVKCKSKEFRSKRLINSMPIHELGNVLEDGGKLKHLTKALLYNSIYIVILQYKNDSVGNHFAFYVPQEDVIFHRVSKLNYLGENYNNQKELTTLMCEITFRPDSYISHFSKKEIVSECIKGIEKINFAKKTNLIDSYIHYEKYAYVIYDLAHRSNTDNCLNYLKEIGIESCGRFAQFEYMNTDKVVEESAKLASKIQPKFNIDKFTEKELSIN